MLSCREMAELTTDFLERRMPLGERLRFRLHVAMCPSCKAYVRKFRELIEALGDLPIAPDVPDELRHRFRNWKGGGTARR